MRNISSAKHPLNPTPPPSINLYTVEPRSLEVLGSLDLPRVNRVIIRQIYETWDFEISSGERVIPVSRSRVNEVLMYYHYADP